MEMPKGVGTDYTDISPTLIGQMAALLVAGRYGGGVGASFLFIDFFFLVNRKQSHKTESKLE